MLIFYRRVLLTLALLAFSVSPVFAEKLASIIIDDLGNNLKYGRSAVNLPGAVTLSILPLTKFSEIIATDANHKGKEVMLHLPLQSVENHKYSPGTLDLHMTSHQFNTQLQKNIDSVPFIKGVNNHMGSLLTKHPGHMDWLMRTLKKNGNLYFIDSVTSNDSVAKTIATENNVPALSRNFFLDPDFKIETIEKQFSLFIDQINRNEYSIAIAHPHPVTLEFLEKNLYKLEEHGIRLVPVSTIIAVKTGGNNVTCTGTTCTGL